MIKAFLNFTLPRFKVSACSSHSPTEKLPESGEHATGPARGSINIEIPHQLGQDGQVELSAFYLALEIKGAYEGMMLPLPNSEWQRYDNLDANELALLLLQMASHADPLRLCKHKRGPKVPKRSGYVSGAQARQHVSTAQVLKNGRLN